MKVLIITGDKTFGPRHPRYDLQRSMVDELAVMYWGRGNMWPKVAGRFDVVTAQDPFWRGLVAWYLARRIRAKLNIQVHTDLSVQPWARHVLAQLVLRHADSVRVVSEKLKEQVQKMGTRSPVQVVSIFLDVNQFRKLARKPHAHKTILWFGRFEPEKDPLYAFEVLRQVRAAGIDARLIMLGKGSLEQSLRRAAETLGETVEFKSWQDPRPFLQVADVVLCTSRHESWGASMVEALAAGVPVVAPDVGVAKEAGATVVARVALATATTEVLKTEMRGQLQLNLPNAREWARQWKETLI